MAIKISGFTIIDDNRNIVNAGIISATNINSSGIITATSFSGNGANLTGLTIPAGFIELDATLFS